MMAASPQIETTLSSHAAHQAQRRGISFETLRLVLMHSDRSQGLPGRARALWISKRKRTRLIHSGFAPSEIDKTSGVRLVINIREDIVMTVEHMRARRRWT